MTKNITNTASGEPQSLEEIENLKKEKLKNLSLNFELDLIRLSKTIKLISQSENISKDYIVYLENRLREFDENLDSLVKKSLDLEEETSKLSLKPVEKNEELGEKLNTYIKEMIALLNDHLNYSRKIKDDLDKKTKEYIDNLDPTRRLYKKELQELHSRLIKQQNSLSNTFIDLSILDDKKSTLPKKSEAKPPTERNPVEGSPVDALRSRINSLKSPINSVLRHGEITYLIMLVLFVFLFFIYFNEGREDKKNLSSKSETLYSRETSNRETPREKELSDSNIGEAKNANVNVEKSKEIKYETIETNSYKNEVESEIMNEAPPEKTILELTVSAANLRKGPDKKYPIASVAKAGDSLEKLDEQGHYIKIKTQSGVEGWIWKKLVREEVE